MLNGRVVVVGLVAAVVGCVDVTQPFERAVGPVARRVRERAVRQQRAREELRIALLPHVPTELRGYARVVMTLSSEIGFMQDL